MYPRIAKTAVTCEVKRLKTVTGRPVGYEAAVRVGSCSWVTAEGPTDAVAREQLAVEVSRVLLNLDDPEVLLGLGDDAVWVASVNFAGQWGYTVSNPGKIAGTLVRGGGSGSWPTRQEAVERMQRHWWQNYMSGFCEALSALARGRWQIVCPKCASVSLVEAVESRPGSMSLQCGSPACGVVVQSQTALEAA